MRVLVLGEDLKRLARLEDEPTAVSAQKKDPVTDSDGLATDLPRLGRASGCAARVLELPAPGAELAAELTSDPQDLAWLGGEDYELLIATAETPPAELGLLRIGELIDGEAGSVSRG